MTPLSKTSARALTLGTTGALVAGLIATTAPANAAVNVDVPPTKTVSGTLSGPIGIEDDDAGRIYVASQNNNAVVVHRKNASGPSVPLRRISGAATGLASPRDVALDSNGFLYVVNFNGTVLVFAPNADGNVAPTKTFGTGAGIALGIDISGGEIYVRKTNRYHVYSPSAAGFPAPVERSVTGLAAGESVAVHGPRVWTQSGNQLRAYSRTADGLATPIQVITNALPASSFGLDTDSAGRIHATTFNGTVRVYAANADGTDAPLKVLGGPASGLTNTTGVALLSGDSLAVANFSENKIRVFAKLITKAPGKVRNLKVAGKAKAKKRKVSWKAPKSNGGEAITKYRIVVKKGGNVLVNRTVNAPKKSIVLKRSALRKGINNVRVRAKNSNGFGPVVKKNFRVRK